MTQRETIMVTFDLEIWVYTISSRSPSEVQNPQLGIYVCTIIAKL